MRQAAPYNDYGRLVARVRHVRRLQGDPARRWSGGQTAGRRAGRTQLRVSMAFCWALCVFLPLATGLRVRGGMGRRTWVDTIEPPPLVRDALIRLLDVAPAARLTTVAGTAEVVAWSPDGHYLAAGYSGGALLLWDVTRRGLTARVSQAHRRFIGALAWSPDGRLLATAAADGKAIVWDATTLPALNPIAVIRTAPLRVPAVAFAPRGATLAVADGLHTVALWDVAPTGTSHGSRAHGSVVRLRQMLSVSGRTTALAWSPDGARLAAGTAEGAVVLWRRNDGWRSATRALGSAVWALAWAPSGSTLAAGCADGAVRLLTSAGLRVGRMLVAPFHRAPVMQVPDYGTLPQRNPPRGREQKRKRGTGNRPRLAAGAAINGVAWSPDGDLLAVTATGVPLRLWRPSGGAVLATYHPVWDQNVVAWRPDGTLATVAMDDGSVTLLRAAEPPFLTDVACHAGLRDWCAPLNHPLAPSGRYSVPPAFMGR